MDKFITKETVVTVVLVVFVVVQMNFFATKLDLAQLEIKLLNIQNENSTSTSKLINDRFDQLNKKIDEELRHKN